MCPVPQKSVHITAAAERENQISEGVNDKGVVGEKRVKGNTSVITGHLDILDL
jgi:hypothetical protein